MTTWHWNTECDTTFNNLKKRFTNFPVLVIPDNAKPLRSKLTHPSSLPVLSSISTTSITLGTLVPSYLNPSPLLNEIIKYIIVNFSALSVPSMLGNIIFKDPPSQLLFSTTIKT